MQATRRRLIGGFLLAVLLAAPAAKAATTDPVVTPDVIYQWCSDWLWYTDPLCWLV